MSLKPNATVFEALKWASLRLSENKLDVSQARSLMMGIQHWNLTQLVAHYQDESPQQTAFEDAVERVISGEPVQYVVGHENFYGNELKVAPGVLIPRLETEELVQWILTDYYHKRDLKVLDIGTGSGAIAISLKKEQPSWQVTASDISTPALSIAKENARNNGAEINFVLSDLFATISNQKFDIIVSNPPYIAYSETDLMDKSVLEFEPHEALFASDDGLAVYKKLADEVADCLQPAGALFLEIGFQQGKTVSDLLQSVNPNRSVELRQDVAGHDRMIKMS